MIKTMQQRLPDVCRIPKFSYIDLGKTDSNGNPIRYSFIQDYTFEIYSNIYSNATVITPEYWPILYNGEFKKYPNIFYSTGTPYQTFTLTDLDILNNIYVDHDNFHIYIETLDKETGKSIYTEWKQVENLILDSNSKSEHFELRLNQKKKYQITFGDNIHGKQLIYGDKIHIIYLQSNVEEGKIQNGEVSIDTLIFDVNGFINSVELIDMCFNGIENFKRNYKGLFVQSNIVNNITNKLTISNIKESTQPRSFEDVDSIKQNAPGMFRLGNRLVTIEDYKNYLITKFSYLIRDVWVCNNTTYLITFYKWLQKYNELTVNIRKYNYMFSDTCDFNNVYIWMKSNTKGDLTIDDMNVILANCNKIKTATVELVPCNAIIKYFIPFVDNINYPINIDNVILSEWKPNIKIRIHKKPGTYFTNTQIIEDVNNIILEYFDVKNQTMGKNINIDEIYSKIMKLDYIESIKTVNIPINDVNRQYSVDGLSFASFSVKIINGKDFDIIRHNDQLLPFQFAQLFVDDIKNMIEIENIDTFSLTNTGF